MATMLPIPSTVDAIVMTDAGQVPDYSSVRSAEAATAVLSTMLRDMIQILDFNDLIDCPVAVEDVVYSEDEDDDEFERAAERVGCPDAAFHATNICYEIATHLRSAVALDDELNATTSDDDEEGDSRMYRSCQMKVEVAPVDGEDFLTLELLPLDLDSGISIDWNGRFNGEAFRAFALGMVLAMTRIARSEIREGETIRGPIRTVNAPETA